MINLGTNGKQIRISGSNLKNCIDNFEDSYLLLFRKWGFESTDLRDDVLGWMRVLIQDGLSFFEFQLFLLAKIPRERKCVHTYWCKFSFSYEIIVRTLFAPIFLFWPRWCDPLQNVVLQAWICQLICDMHPHLQIPNTGLDK